MTDARQAIADAFTSNYNEPMTISDIKNITHVSYAVIRSMINNKTLKPVSQQIKNRLEEINYFDTKK